jgi:uncharacterized protein (TIGR02996 family)
VSQLSDLLEAVAASRDDDAPRRVYADALLEQGDPLGEFIHVQCDLAAGGLSREESIKRRRRERELLTANQERWTARLPEPLQGFRFVRGFLEHLEISAESWPVRGDELFDRAPALRSVMLSDVHLRAYDHGGDEVTARLLLTRLEQALASPLLRRLDGFGHHAVGYVVSDPIYEMSESVGENRYERSAYLGLEALQVLVAADLSHLRRLSLSIVAERADALAAAPVVKQLEHLDLIALTDPGSVLAALDPTRLRVLTLSDWHEGLARFPDLRDLRLTWGHKPLGPLPPGLTRFTFATPELTAAHVAAIAACPQLEELELLAQSMPGFSALEHAPFKGLKRVQLAGTKTVVEHCRQLARWPLAERLELVQLRGGTKAEIAELEALFGCVVEVRR